jgi:hypothetical protein
MAYSLHRRLLRRATGKRIIIIKAKPREEFHHDNKIMGKERKMIKIR